MSWEEQSDEVLLVIRITEQLANTLPHFSPHYCLSLHTLLYCRQLCASQFLAAFHLSPWREENTWDLRRRNVTISVKVWCPAVSGRASVVASGSGPPPPLIGNKRSDSRAWHKVKLGNWNLVYFDIYQSIQVYIIPLHYVLLQYIITLYYYTILHYIKHTTLYIETPSEIFSIHIHMYGEKVE